MKSIFHTPEGRALIDQWYDRFLAKLTFPYERRTVPTRFGDTHLILAGPADAPPVVVLHGALAGAPHALGEMPSLAKRFRLIALDIVGSSVKSAETRPPVQDASYGHWVMDVLDALKVPRASVYGGSWGGLVALRTVQAAPDRVDKLVLLVPGGIARAGGWSGFARVAWPMMMYRMFPSPARLLAFTSPQMTSRNEDWEQFLGDAVRHCKLDFRLPPNATREMVGAFKGPVYAIGADDDVHFPGPAVLARVKEMFPNVVKTELLANCRHMPPTDDAFRDALSARIGDFLAGESARATG